MGPGPGALAAEEKALLRPVRGGWGAQRGGEQGTGRAGGRSHLVRKVPSPEGRVLSHWHSGAKTEQFFTLGKVFSNRSRNNVKRKTQAQVIPQLTPREGHCALSLEKALIYGVTLTVASSPHARPVLLGAHSPVTTRCTR